MDFKRIDFTKDMLNYIRKQHIIFSLLDSEKYRVTIQELLRTNEPMTYLELQRRLKLNQGVSMSKQQLYILGSKLKEYGTPLEVKGGGKFGRNTIKVSPHFRNRIIRELS